MTSPPAPCSSAEALGILLLQTITTVLKERQSIRLVVIDASGQTVNVTVSMPAAGEAP